MSGSTLISTRQLASRLGAWRLFDCRNDLADPTLGERQYREAHIPGARFAHLEQNLSGAKTGSNGRHPLPDPEDFAAWLGREGLKSTDAVVCYDGGNGAMAARLWWMLRWLGHESVAVLDGGFALWRKEGRPVSTEIPSFAPTRYTPRLRAGTALGVRDVQQGLGQLLLVDARAPARYRGDEEPIDPVAGRIPGALNRFNSENLSPEGTFKKPDALAQEWRALLAGRPPDEAVHYCGSGVAACHNLLALEIAGLPGGKLYAGSWSEWSADPARPQERG